MFDFVHILTIVEPSHTHHLIKDSLSIEHMSTKETKIFELLHTTCSVLCRVDRGWEEDTMNTRWINVVAGITMFVLCISVCTTTSSASTVWEDNFDDGNYDGWTIRGYENATSQVLIEGNFSATSDKLTVLDDDINVARHDSPTSVGTWSFDMFVPADVDGHGVIDVMFMSNGSRPIAFASMFVSVEAYYDQNRFDIWEMRGADGVLFDTWSPGLPGWHHIDVSRSDNGRFRVWFNGTIRSDFVSNDVTSSTYFEFFCANASGAAIDNIVVDDDPEKIAPLTTTNGGTTPPAQIPWDLIAIGSGVAVVVIVVAIVCLKRR
jgi:hypothetical protein